VKNIHHSSFSSCKEHVLIPEINWIRLIFLVKYLGSSGPSSVESLWNNITVSYESLFTAVESRLLQLSFFSASSVLHFVCLIVLSHSGLALTLPTCQMFFSLSPCVHLLPSYFPSALFQQIWMFGINMNEPCVSPLGFTGLWRRQAPRLYVSLPSFFFSAVSFLLIFLQLIPPINLPLLHVCVFVISIYIINTHNRWRNIQKQAARTLFAYLPHFKLEICQCSYFSF